MTKRKTVAAQRRDALVRKKIEKRNILHNSVQAEEEVDGQLLEKTLIAIGIRGGFQHLPLCDSTNNVMKRYAHSMMMSESQRLNSFVKPPSFTENIAGWTINLLAPKALPFVLVADAQTDGRGRQSNTWWTGQGALAFSMLLDAKQHGLKPQKMALLSIGIGYATMQALRLIAEQILAKINIDTENDVNAKSAAMPNIEIRWPNDVYVNDRKIAGILIEAPNLRHIVIGIGINTNNSAEDAPEEIRDRIVTLSDVLNQNIDHDALIYFLCREIIDVIYCFPSHIPELLEIVEANLYQVDKMVNISQENGNIIGKCLGLNPDGSLRVLTETGEKAVISGVTV